MSRNENDTAGDDADANDIVTAKLPLYTNSSATGTSSVDDTQRWKDSTEEKESSQPPFSNSVASTTTTTATKNYCQSLHAILRSMMEVDTTALNVVPGMRTAAILMLEWSLWGIGRPESTPFQLAALFVGLVDPHCSLGKRLRYMGLTLTMVWILGSVLPGWVWDSKGANLGAAFGVALLTGYAPLGGSPALFMAMKLATALFAVNGGVNRSTNGFSEVEGGQVTFVLYAFVGGAVSLVAALLPEILGTRDALRSNLFQLFFGFSRILERWRSKIGTREKMKSVPVPTVTVAISKLETIISKDITVEDTVGKEWASDLVRTTDCMKAALLCLANVFPVSETREGANNKDNKRTQEQLKCVDNIFVGVGHALRYISFALQFPWLLRWNPLFWHWYRKSIQAVQDATSSLDDCCCGLSGDTDILLAHGEDVTSWLPPIAELINSKLKSVSSHVADTQARPPRESVTSLPKRLSSAFGLPSRDTIHQKTHDWTVHSFAWRFAATFTVAMLPEIFLGKGYRAHWLPMTTALIMVPAQAANYEKIIHRVLGTLLGLLVGTALLPLFDYVVPHILLLGLFTFSTVCFFPANYAYFTFSITCWVVTTVIGVGAPWDETVFYRVMWTLVAGLLVLLATTAAPTKSDIHLGSKLGAMAKAIKKFTIVAMEEHTRVCKISGEMAESGELIDNQEDKKTRVYAARKDVIDARLALLQSLSEAAMTPGAGHFVIDPHSMAPAIASDLIEAAVIPQTLLLVPYESASGLVADIDDLSYQELDRLVRRLERYGDSKGLSPATSKYVTTISGARGPFSRSIARAHKRLDEGQFPSESTKQSVLPT